MVNDICSLTYYEANGELPKTFQELRKALMTIPPTSNKDIFVCLHFKYKILPKRVQKLVKMVLKSIKSGQNYQITVETLQIKSFICTKTPLFLS